MRPMTILLTTLLMSAGRGLADEPNAPATQPDTKRNPRLLEMPPNQWLKLHEQKRGDKVRFMRQAHGGSCFDTKRGRLILFGSNTHGRDWTNSPLFFDPVAEKWTRLYSDDPRTTYRVTESGIPVAGPNGDHPWAMHTFGAVEYDPKRDEVIVACAPLHMVPGRFTNSVKDLWPKIKKHPTWVLELKTNHWRALACKPEHFFPHSACFDTDRNVVIGFRGGAQVYELAGEPRAWTKTAAKSGLLPGWHNNSAYDGKHKAMVSFGYNRNSNDIVAYFTKTRELKKMPTPGDRPPADQHNPMAFEPRLGRTVIVADHRLEPDNGANSKTVAETWLYDLGDDTWTQVKNATLPFGCGMNYNMEYDPGHHCLLLVTGGYSGQATTVWALRIERKESQKE